MRDLLQDLRFGIRILLKRPLFLTTAVLTLGLGIGANSAIFSLVNGFLLQPLPYPDGERIFIVWGHHPQIGRETASLPDFLDWRSRSRSFRKMAAFVGWAPVWTGKDEPRRLRGSRVSADFFSTLGVRPAMGRDFTSQDDQPGQPRVVIVSHSLWRSLSAADPMQTDLTVTLNGHPYQVVGVLPPGFSHPHPDRSQLDVWSPLAFSPDRFGRRSDFLNVVGRLGEGVSAESAEAEMTTIAAALAQEYPATNASWSVQLEPLRERLVGETRRALLVLLGAVAFVLLIACANVANLMLSRQSERRREMAVRVALGAGKATLLRHSLIESAVLGLLGGAAGLLFAFWGLDFLKSLAPAGLNRLENIEIDGAVLAFTLGISLLTAVLFGMLPGLRAAAGDVNAALKEGSRRSTAPASGRRTRRILVVGEVALALALLAGAGMLIRSFANLLRVDPGFDGDNVVTFRLSLPSARYAGSDEVAAFYDRFLQRLEAIAPVREAGAVSDLPLGGGANYLSFDVEGRPPAPQGEVQDAQVFSVTPGYFRALRIPLKTGRFFNAADRQEAPRVALINEEMAKRYWPGREPIGARIDFGIPDPGTFLTIVGVVGDVKHEGLDTQSYPQTYVPQAQALQRSLAFAVRTDSDAASLAPTLRREVWAIDPDLAVQDFATMSQIRSQSMALPRLRTMLLAVFAGLALVLALVGIYGLMAYSVSQRFNEIGIRMALGARRADVARLVVAQGVKLLLVGIGIGCLLSLILARAISAFLFGVSHNDPITFLTVSLGMLAAGTAACWIPARRASRIDPIQVLRYE